ncbi:MAG: metallophosphoesterase family protein [Desulfovibrio sp.]|uniref:metallophosphoesterase family protein n=1 Tax=Desulfovibrio sp. 7SRBS1 TaxID=3378064 RepID=UPI003B3C03A8
MKIAVLSDTHAFEPTPWHEEIFQQYMAGADAIIHCGDITGVNFYHWLVGSHPRVHAVAGNMCEYNLAAELNDTLTLEYEGFRIGVAHGWGPRSQVPYKVVQSFGPGYDIICFGHTHRFFWETIDFTWALNPGSLQEHEPSMALLTLEKGERPVVQRVIP